MLKGFFLGWNRNVIFKVRNWINHRGKIIFPLSPTLSPFSTRANQSVSMSEETVHGSCETYIKNMTSISNMIDRRIAFSSPHLTTSKSANETVFWQRRFFTTTKNINYSAVPAYSATTQKEESLSGKSLRCSYCAKSFRREDALKIHVLSNHKQQENVFTSKTMTYESLIKSYYEKEDAFFEKQFRKKKKKHKVYDEDETYEERRERLRQEKEQREKLRHKSECMTDIPLVLELVAAWDAFELQEDKLAKENVEEGEILPPEYQKFEPVTTEEIKEYIVKRKECLGYDEDNFSWKSEGIPLHVHQRAEIIRAAKDCQKAKEISFGQRELQMTQPNPYQTGAKPETETQTQHTCPVCNKGYRSLTALKFHLDTMHKKNEMVEPNVSKEEAEFEENAGASDFPLENENRNGSFQADQELDQTVTKEQTGNNMKQEQNDGEKQEQPRETLNVGNQDVNYNKEIPKSQETSSYLRQNQSTPTSAAPNPFAQQASIPSISTAPNPFAQQASIPSTSTAPNPFAQQASIPSISAAPNPFAQQASIPSTSTAPNPFAQQASIPSTSTAPNPFAQQASIPSTSTAPNPFAQQDLNSFHKYST